MTVNRENLNFFKKIYRAVSTLFVYLLKQTKMFTKSGTGAPRYIPIKSFFLAIGQSYLHDLSHTFSKRLRVKLYFKSASLTTDNGRTSRLSSFNSISNHKNHKNIPKNIDNALTDFVRTVLSDEKYGSKLNR